MRVGSSTHAATTRVLLVTELGEGADEGMRNWARQLQVAVSGGGYEVDLLRLGGDPRMAAFRPSAWRAVRRASPDVVAYVPYSGLTRKALVRLRALCAATPRALRGIVVLQAGDWPGRRWLPLADLALTGSSRLARACDDVARVVAPIPPVVDTQRFRPAAADRRKIKEELGFAPDRPLVLHVGHLRKSRNLDVLARLAETGERQVLMIASMSTDPEPGVRERLEAAGGRVVREFLPDIARYYQAADLYVFPVVDPRGCAEVPLSVLEALAVETPVIATPFGALPELLPDSPELRYVTPAELPAAVAEGPPARGGEMRAFLERFTSERLAAAFDAAVRRASRRRRGYGAVVQLSGLDAAGKSTQVEQLTASFRARGLRVGTLWCRWDPRLARPAVKLLDAFSGKDGGEPSVPQPARRDERRRLRKRVLDNPLLRRLWLVVMVVDYGIPTAFRVRRRRRRVDLLILDRYWHDVLIDFSAGGPLAKPPGLLRRLLPDPDTMLLLDVPVEVALTRQSEALDRTYFEHRRELYEAAADRYGAVVIDASQDIDAVAHDLSERVAALVGHHEDELP